VLGTHLSSLPGKLAGLSEKDPPKSELFLSWRAIPLGIGQTGRVHAKNQRKFRRSAGKIPSMSSRPVRQDAVEPEIGAPLIHGRLDRQRPRTVSSRQSCATTRSSSLTDLMSTGAHIRDLLLTFSSGQCGAIERGTSISPSRRSHVHAGQSGHISRREGDGEYSGHGPARRGTLELVSTGLSADRADLKDYASRCAENWRRCWKVCISPTIIRLSSSQRAVACQSAADYRSASSGAIVAEVARRWT